MLCLLNCFIVVIPILVVFVHVYVKIRTATGNFNSKIILNQHLSGLLLGSKLSYPFRLSPLCKGTKNRLLLRAGDTTKWQAAGTRSSPKLPAHPLNIEVWIAFWQVET